MEVAGWYWCNVGLVLRCDTATTQGASLAEFDPISATAAIFNKNVTSLQV